MMQHNPMVNKTSICIYTLVIIVLWTAVFMYTRRGTSLVAMETTAYELFENEEDKDEV
jgi:hypothetical protein